jgi:hypothetical protein
LGRCRRRLCTKGSHISTQTARTNRRRYAELLRELEARQAALPPESPEQAALGSKRLAIERGRDGRLGELGAKDRLSAEISLLSLLRLYLPRVVFAGTLAGKRREAPLALTWDPVERTGAQPGACVAMASPTRWAFASSGLTSTDFTPLPSPLGCTTPDSTITEVTMDGSSTQPEAKEWPLGRRVDDLPDHRQLDRADHVMRGIVPEPVPTEHELFATLRDHAEGGLVEAVEAFGRPRTAAEVQTRLRLDRPVARHRPRDPVGELLLVGPHATGLSFAGCVHHVPHRKHLRRSRRRAETPFGGLYKHLRGSSYRLVESPA